MNSATHTLLHNSKSVEWFTPARYSEVARLVLGSFDLDPASCTAARFTVKAAHHYTEADNGLTKPWRNRAWINPPYGRINVQSGQELFSSKLIEEFTSRRVTAVITLCNVATDCKWFAPLWKYPICFTDHRIKFISSTNGKAKQPTYGSAFAYLGDDRPALSMYFASSGTS